MSDDELPDVRLPAGFVAYQDQQRAIARGQAAAHAAYLLGLIEHGVDRIVFDGALTFESIRDMLEKGTGSEGIVWHHPDGRMAKIKRKDFGFDWPVE